MEVYFVTGSPDKFAEAQAIIPSLQRLDIDLPEIQEIDAKKIIKAKLEEARKHKAVAMIVEDTSLYFDCLRGLPGPLIKWFVKSLGNEGLVELASKMGDVKAQAVTLVGYADNDGNISYFEGLVPGQIVHDRGGEGFGWDQVFLPDGHELTFAQMGREEKNKISMRKMAFQKLVDFLP